MKRTFWIYALIAGAAVFCAVARKEFNSEIRAPNGNPNSEARDPKEVQNPNPTPPTETRKAERNQFNAPALQNFGVLTNAEPPFVRFLDWAQRFISSPHDTNALSEGIQLAQARRAEMAETIRRDPERALQLALPLELRSALPREVRSLLEENFSGRGTLEVAVLAPPAPGERRTEPSVIYTATIGDRMFRAFPYGRRAQLPTRENVVMRGIVLDDLFAIHEDPVRVLEAAETARFKSARKQEAFCAVSQQPADSRGEETFVDAGGEIFALCGTDHLAEFSEELLREESQISIKSAWTEGPKKVLFMRVDYSDATGSPVSGSSLTNMLNGARRGYEAYSYGRTKLAAFGQGSDWTTLLRMPSPKTAYGDGQLTKIVNDAKAAAEAAGTNTALYDFHVVCSVKTAVSTANALAKVGSSGVLMNGSFVATLYTHEQGHNFGVWHANYWQPNNGDPLDVNGTHVEYGDIYDIMGGDAGGWDINNQHFNVDHKIRLDWIKSGEYQTVTTSGTYRLWQHDNTNSLGKGLLALRVPFSSSRNFMIEYRRLAITDPGDWLKYGVGIRWGYNANNSNGSRLIDVTPDSRSGGAKADRRDSPLVIGRTFSDSANGIHITPVALGNTTPPSIDVVVNLGTFAGNIPPSLTISGATNGVPNQTLAFTANATDTNGDALAYYWDFFNGTEYNTEFQSANTNIITRAWSAVGTYKVRCRVTDMKGGTDMREVTVFISNTPPSPSITQQPQSQSVTVGSNVTFSVVASGTGLNYQWRFNTTNLPGANASSLALNNVQFTDAGDYSVVVSNSGGAITSAVAQLTVTAPPGTNFPPLLSPIENRVARAGSLLTFTNSAYDPNPTDVLTFSLGAGAPATAAIHPQTGVFAWTPTDADTNSVHAITVRVTDNGTPAMSATANFSVTVLPPLPPNHPPLLLPIASRTVHAGSAITFTNLAFDSDGDALTFSLDPGAPASAFVDATNGVFTWTPGDADAGTMKTIKVRATDDGEPPMSATVTFAVTVQPRPTFQSIVLIDGGCALTWSAIAGARYIVEFKDDLDDEEWQPIGESITAESNIAGTEDVSVEEFPQRRFYRVKVVQE